MVTVKTTGVDSGTAWEYSLSYSGGVQTLEYVADGTILNDDFYLEWSVADPDTLEDSGEPIRFLLTRTGDLSSAMSVAVAVGGSATLADDYELVISDYTGSPGPYSTATIDASFGVGQDTLTFIATPVADTTAEFTETITLTVLPSSGLPGVPGAETVTGRIINDESLFSTAFDLVFLQDLSGSFSDDIATVRGLLPTLLTDINGVQPNTPIAVTSFVDKPIGPFGGSSDYAYRTDLSATTEAAAIVAAYDGFSANGGEDGPESQLEALLQVALRDGELGLRPTARTVAVLFTDAGYHMAGDGAAAGITAPNNLDAVLDGTPASTGEDYPELAGLRSALLAANVLPVFAVTASEVSTYQWLVNTIAVGGGVVELSSDSSNIVEAISTGLSNLFLLEARLPDGSLATSGLTVDDDG